MCSRCELAAFSDRNEFVQTFPAIDVHGLSLYSINVLLLAVLLANWHCTTLHTLFLPVGEV
ncbi:hypothetical protein Pta6605_42690 [Pseudomonas amygdali pv. tabaci]|nr:hypothetical protein Pta6605_42690 [Pseudomonas amygdali pv. tabaci]